MRGPEQLGPYTLVQPEGVFPLGEDALALGGFATVKRGRRVCDLGTGSGVLLLMLAGREPSLALWGIERDPLSAQAARDNLARNGLTGEIWTGDWGECPFPPGSFDLVVSRNVLWNLERPEQGHVFLSGEEIMEPLRRYTAPVIASGADTAIFGCTHFPFVQPLFEELCGDTIAFVDPAHEMALQTLEVLKKGGLLNHDRLPGYLRLCFTAEARRGGKLAEHLIPANEFTVEEISFA